MNFCRNFHISFVAVPRDQLLPVSLAPSLPNAHVVVRSLDPRMENSVLTSPKITFFPKRSSCRIPISNSVSMWVAPFGEGGAMFGRLAVCHIRVAVRCHGGVPCFRCHVGCYWWHSQVPLLWSPCSRDTLEMLFFIILFHSFKNVTLALRPEENVQTRKAGSQ